LCIQIPLGKVAKDLQSWNRDLYAQALLKHVKLAYITWTHE